MSKVINRILAGNRGRGLEKSDEDANVDWRIRLLRENALEQDQADSDEDAEIVNELKALNSNPANQILVVEANNPTGQSTGNPGNLQRIIGQQTGTASTATSKLAARRRTNASRTSFN